MLAPGTLAAANVEHIAQRMRQAVLRLRHRQRHLPPHVGRRIHALAAVPLVEGSLVVAFHRFGRMSARYSFGIFLNSRPPRGGISSSLIASARTNPSISPSRPSSSHPVQISVSL